MEVVGVRAVIDGVQQYTAGAQKIEQSTARMGQAVDNTASKSGKLNVFGSALGGVASIASGFIIGQGILQAPGILVAAANAAAEDAASTAKLQRAVENTGHAWTDYSKRISETIEVAQKRGFTDDQARDSLAILTAQTDDAGEALNRFSIAQDLSRGTGMDVVSASRLLGKVTDENVNVLKRYGISVEKGAGETELLAAVQRKFSGQAETFSKSAAGQAATAKIAFGELAESVGYIILPIMGALAKLLNAAVIPALNKMVQFIGPKMQTEGKKLAAILQASGIVKFAKDAGAALGSLAKYLGFVADEGDLLNDFLADLPPAARPAAIVLGMVVEVVKEVGRQLVDLARMGGDVLQFVGRLVSKVNDFLPPGRQFNLTLAKIGDNQAGIKAIAAAITAFIAVLATAQVLAFASSIATMASSVIAFPVRALSGAMSTITGFGRAAKTAADDAETAASKVAGVAGTKAGQCADQTAECVQHVTQTGDKPITSDPIVKEIVQHVTVKEDPPGQAKTLGAKLGQGIAQGIGAAIEAAIVVSPGAALVAAGALAGVIVAPLTVAIAAAVTLAPLLIVAGVAALVVKFRKALVAALQQVPRALAFVGGAIAAAILFQFVGVPVLIIHAIVEGLKKGVPLLVEGGAKLGRGLISGLEFLKDGIPELVGRAVLAAVQASFRYVRFMDQEVPRIIARAFQSAVDAIPGILAAIPGFIAAVVRGMVAEARKLPGQIASIFEELPGITERSASGVLDVTRRIFGAVLDFITGLPFASVVADIMRQVVEGFRSGFQQVDDLTGNILSQTFETVRGFATDVVAAFGTIASGIATAFSGIGSAITGAFGSVRQVISAAIAFVAGQVADFIQNVKDALDAIPGPNPAGNALQAAIDAMRQTSSPGPAGGQAQPGSQVPAGFMHLAGGSAGLPFPTLAVMNERGNEAAFLPAGTVVAPAQTTSRLLALLSSLAGMTPGRGAAQLQSVGISMPISISVAGMDWETIRRQVHREVDSVFSSARSRSTRAGAPVGSGIG